MSDRFIRERECREISGLSRTTRWRQERKGQFPQRRKLSDNAVGWLFSELMAWVNERSTCQASPNVGATTKAVTASADEKLAAPAIPAPNQHERKPHDGAEPARRPVTFKG